MTTFRIAAIACIAALTAACNQEPPAPAAQPENEQAVANAPAASTSTQGCRALAPPLDSAGLETLGAVGGYSIAATRGALVCNEPAGESVDCEARGPGEIHIVSSQAQIGYALDQGQTATLQVGPGEQSCSLQVRVN